MATADLSERAGRTIEKLAARRVDFQRQAHGQRLGPSGQQLQHFVLGAGEIGKSVDEHVGHALEGTKVALPQLGPRRPEQTLGVVQVVLGQSLLVTGIEPAQLPVLGTRRTPRAADNSSGQISSRFNS